MTGKYKNVLELIGDTPLVQLNRINQDIPGEVYAKLECYNPGHSTKDRIALHIIEEAEKNGLLKPGATIVETTSGNTGFAVAMVAIVKGYKCILAVSDKTKAEKISFLKAMGAKVFLCPANVPADDPRSYYEVAKRIAAETPNSLYINQYFNQGNTEAHYLTTGPEIWNDTDGQVDAFVAGVGTGGTITGTGEYLKSKNPDVKIVAVEPETSAVLSTGKAGAHKIQGIGAGFVPNTLNTEVYDEIIPVSNEASFEYGKIIAKEEGVLVGISSGAALYAAIEVAKRPEFKGKTVVALLPDSGDRYYSTDLFKD